MGIKRRDPIQVFDAADAKVRKIFRQFGSKRIENLEGGRFPFAIAKAIERAARSEIRASKRRHEFAFHMVDWNSDAARMVALLLYPERFTKEETWSLVYNIVIHAPNHMAAAAKLAGEPIKDLFGVGALDGDGVAVHRKVIRDMRKRKRQR